ncbi:MAG: acetyl-CoA carboxylase carboxyl transferase subunit alpha, partial [Bacteroidia bacterium]
MAHFDFEKPIQDLEDQLKKVKEVADKGKIDVNASIKELEEKIISTKKELYSNLNGWQRVQV